MQRHYPTQFVRDMGCTEAEWRRWLPQALGERAWHEVATPAPASPDASSSHLGDASSSHVVVDLDTGRLHLTWRPLAPRRLGLAVLPRLQMCFDFDPDITAAQRHAFMRRFDLYTQRGGG